MAILKKPGGLKPKTGLKSGRTLARKPQRASDEFTGAPKHRVSSTGAFAAARAERSKQELERLKPWNLSVPVGGSVEVYILDEGEPWKRYEHNIGGGPSSRGKMYPCIKDSSEQCPLCTREGKEGAFVMYLTCVVPKETYEKQDGTTVTRRFQKKLFPVKTKMSGKYERLFETHGSLRGAVLKVSRDNKLDPATGNDVEFVRRLSEAQIKQYATGAGFKGETLEQIKKSKIAQPFDYDKVMPTPSAKDLAAMVGMRTGGSVGNADFKDDDDDGFVAEDDWGGTD